MIREKREKLYLALLNGQNGQHLLMVTKIEMEIKDLVGQIKQISQQLFNKLGLSCATLRYS